MVVVPLKWILMRPHRLTNFEIRKYYQNEPRFNGVYSRDNLPKIKDRAYIIILMSTLILGIIGLLCMLIMVMLLISTLLVQNLFQKKLKHLLIVLCPLSLVLRFVMLCKIKHSNKYF